MKPTREQVEALGYLDPKQLADGSWAAIYHMLMTTAIVVVDNTEMYRHRYCYEHESDARAALAAWDGSTEHPPGPWIKRKPGDLRNPNKETEPCETPKP